MQPQDIQLIAAVIALAAFALFAIVMSFIKFSRNPEGRYSDDTHDREHGTGRSNAGSPRPTR